MSNTEPPTPHHETPALIAALSDSALRRASSAAIFQRGKTYATSGAVQVLSEEPGDTPAIYAQVAGSDTHEPPRRSGDGGTPTVGGCTGSAVRY
jgi:hypothetical protein